MWVESPKLSICELGLRFNALRCLARFPPKKETKTCLRSLTPSNADRLQEPSAGHCVAVGTSQPSNKWARAPIQAESLQPTGARTCFQLGIMWFFILVFFVAGGALAR